MQIFQQYPQRTLLFLSACVLGCLAVGSQSADIAYSDAMVVVVLAVGTLHFLRPTHFNRPVRRNNIVIPASLPTEGTVVAVNVRHPQCAALLIGRAMHDNKCNLTHKHLFYMFGTRITADQRNDIHGNSRSKKKTTHRVHRLHHRRYGAWYLRRQFTASGRGCYFRTAMQRYNDNALISSLFIPVQKLFRNHAYFADFVHSRSRSFKASMDVRPGTLCTYVLTP